MSVTAPKGFRAAGVTAGLKASGKPDLALIVNEGPSRVAAAVLTANRVHAAPVAWTRQAVADGRARAVVLNSGGANACTGKPGYADTVATAERAALLLSCEPTEVLVCSTGLIGERLNMDKLLPGIEQAELQLDAYEDGGEDGAWQGGADAAVAIMTTDTRPKQTLAVDPGGWSIGGMAKGAGMLAPGLATMLCVLTTDANVDAKLADAALRAATATTFDRVDSDGCMSTNDTVILLANGASGVSPDAAVFAEALTAACADLARQLVADAEGASHDIVITVRGATTENAAVAVARAVARSNLFKAAIFGNDPNWGRVLSAVGTVPEEVAPFDPDSLDVAINGVKVCRAGGVGEPRELVDLAVSREVQVDIDLHAGNAEATLLTNDLTHDYVHENSAYST
ncbi:MAG: bifunctional glutamate N-acetyltransferase/amino-acid acetyltransferase ArgJ [Promicromonosporaceae bacterium]|nr:bifunctional glutamate N-acetyltransferase/amino-acid acetyltransferase ArgJ [Promicromonosporaceae bacterium]